MSKVDPDEFMIIANILDGMRKANIAWPDRLYVRSNRIDLQYDLEEPE